MRTWSTAGGLDVRERAFTLPEVMLSIAIMSILVVGLYVGLSQGFAVVQVTRENLRGPQILQEETEVIRLYSWDQVLSNYINVIGQNLVPTVEADDFGFLLEDLGAPKVFPGDLHHGESLAQADVKSHNQNGHNRDGQHHLRKGERPLPYIQSARC